MFSVLLFTVVVPINVALPADTIEFQRGVPASDRSFILGFLRKVFAEDIAIGMEKIYDPPFDKIELDDQMIAYSDLNADATPEMLLRIVHTSVCGSAGCQTYIFRRSGSRWVLIGEFYTGRSVITDGTRHGGWLALYSFNMCAIWTRNRYIGRTRNKRMPETMSSCMSG